VKKTLVFILVTSFVLSIAGTALAFPIDFNGDVRVKFDTWHDDIDGPDAGNGNDEGSRLRLNISSQIDNNTSLYGRFGSRITWGIPTYPGYGKTSMDLYGVKFSDADWTYTLGRQGVSLGQGSIIWTGSDVGYDSKFDGLTAAGKFGVVNSQFIVGKTTDSTIAAYIAADGFTNAYSANWWGADFSVPVNDNLTFGSTWASEKINATAQTPIKYLSVNATFNPSDKLSLYGEYVKSNADNYNKAYFIAACYSWDNDWFSIEYNNVEANAVDRGISGIGAWMYPNIGYDLDVGSKYRGFTYTYNHQLSKATAFDINFMSLSDEGQNGNDNECTAYVQWDF